MAYVEGFVVPVPTGKRAEYLAMAQRVAAAFKEYGALSVVECWGHEVPEGKVTSFPLSVKLEPGETVVFSWIRWPSREVRDAGHAKFVADLRMEKEEMPFDGKRMIWGGFDVILDV
jgi:uncharacterized protein YbaA (DUF1428 family)